jgi:hypothetical protein
MKRRAAFRTLCFALVAAGLGAVAFGRGGGAGGEDLLRIEASLRPKSLSRKEEGRVVIKVILKEGIVISPHPTFTIEFVPNRELIFPKNFYTNSDLNIEVLEEDGQQYLNLEPPIEIPFTVSLEAKRGGHILEGRIKYFACSRKEGWCLKDSAEFSIPFFTRQSIKKK